MSIVIESQTYPIGSEGYYSVTFVYHEHAQDGERHKVETKWYPHKPNCYELKRKEFSDRYNGLRRWFVIQTARKISLGNFLLLKEGQP